MSQTDAVLSETEGWVEVEIRERREQFALSFTRYIAWVVTAGMVVLPVLWFFVQEYVQLVLGLVPLILLWGTSWLYPVLHRRGQTTIGMWAFLLALLLTVAIFAALMPELMVGPAIGYVLLIIVSNLLLGARNSLGLIAISILALAADIVLMGMGVSTLFPATLDPLIVMMVNLFLGVMASLLAVAIVRQIVIDQEEYLRQSKLTSRELERRAAAEQQQRERLQASVERYAEYTTEVGQGNLAAHLRLTEDERQTDDPLIVLGHRLSEMVASLRDMIFRIREAADNVSTASAEIVTATMQQVAGANEQSAAIAQTTTTVDEVRALADQSVVRAQEVSDTARRTMEVSQTGQQAVQATIASMDQIKTRVEGIAENSVALLERMKQIGEIIDTVNAIASQSNMLALNASIEAARAGEHGKGFAAVAQEVRALADQSRQATAQVKTILSDIQRATDATVMATEEGTKGVEEGVRLVMQAQEGIEQLAAAITESAQAATQVVAGGQQQATGIKQIALAMRNINQATSQSLTSIRQTENAAQDLNRLSTDLREIVVQYQV